MTKQEVKRRGGSVTVCLVMRRMAEVYKKRLQKHLWKCRKCDVGIITLGKGE